jgi:predicted DCC family thiol-disulfide oxidoreductase YuxK
MNIAYPMRIYYDASCPLCRTEMHALKQYDMHQRLDLVDCSPANFSDDYANKAGYQQTAMMRLIHARDANGVWLIGVAVFEAAYGATGIIGMEKMWANPRLRPLWDRIYPWIADNRMILSKLGITKLFGWMVTRAAKKANAKSQACKDDLCELK